MLTKILLAGWLLAFAWLPAVAQAENGDLDRVVKTLESPFRGNASAQASIRDFTADFHQESRIVSLDRGQRGKGRVTIQFGQAGTGQPLPAKFRWEYQEPSRQEIVSDGRVLWVYVPENHQAIRSELDKVTPAGADNPLTFLTGLGNLSRDFIIEWASPNRTEEGDWVLVLRPRKPSAVLARLQIVVDRRAVQEFTKEGRPGRHLPIRSSTVYDPNGNSTHLEFTNPRTNRSPAPSEFDFTPPPGVEVVSPALPGTGS